MNATGSCLRREKEYSHPWHQFKGSEQKVARSLMPALSAVAQGTCCGSVEEQGMSLDDYLTLREAIIRQKVQQHAALDASHTYSPLLESPPCQASVAHQQLRGVAAMMACHPALVSTTTTSRPKVSVYGEQRLYQ